MIFRYFSIAVAVCMTLAGVQIPGFADHYENRASAHLAEVRANLSGFQAVADRYHDGSIPRLIEHHRRSTDPTFRSEAEVIQLMLEREARFDHQVSQLQGAIVTRAVHLLTNADRQLLEDSTATYTWTITLDDDALVCGGAALLVGIGITELLRLLIMLPFRRRTAST